MRSALVPAGLADNHNDTDPHCAMPWRNYTRIAFRGLSADIPGMVGLAFAWGSSAGGIGGPDLLRAGPPPESPLDPNLHEAPWLDLAGEVQGPSLPA